MQDFSWKFLSSSSGTEVIGVGRPKVESGRKTSPVSPVLPVVKTLKPQLPSLPHEILAAPTPVLLLAHQLEARFLIDRPRRREFALRP
jgi:hypothetical protein